jgi:hypothetical protein
VIWNSQSNSFCPILTLRLNETFTTSDRSPAPSLLLTLPLEILEMILNLVLQNLLLQMKSRRRPRLILSQYRALILTCKWFKVIIDHGSPRVHMNLTAKRYRIGQYVVYCPNIRLVNDHNIHDMEKEPLFTKRYFTQWSVIFKVYQKISILHAHLNYDDPPEYLDAVGKFWLNDRVSLTDFRKIYRERYYQVDLLLIMSGAIQKRAHPIEESCGDVATLPGLEWYLHRHTTNMRRVVDIDRVIRYAETGWSDLRYIYSVRDWRVPGDPILRGSLIAPEVTEWWIWLRQSRQGQLEYASAYLDGKVWVFDFASSELYTNFRQIVKIGDFGASTETRGSFTQGWVCKWPRFIEVAGGPSLRDMEKMRNEARESKALQAI